MTNTPTPWYATGVHVQSAVKNEDNYVCTAEGSSPEEAIANADLIVRAVNSHDALVSALVSALTNLRSRNHPTEFDLECIEAGDKALALAQEVRA
jgi:hypothetical protein